MSPSPAAPRTSPAVEPNAYRFEHPGLRQVLRDLFIHEGEPGPSDVLGDFHLPLTTGSALTSASFGAQRKPLLLIFGSRSCPVMVSGVDGLKQLHARYGSHVNLVMVQVREAHPGDRIPQPHTFEQKMRHAIVLKRACRLPFDVAVDSIDGALHQTLGGRPHSAHLLLPSGATLRILPSQLIPFDQFQQSYPNGLVLSRDTGFQRDYGRNPYTGYEFGKGPIMPVRSSRATSLRPMEKLVVVKDGKRYRAYPMSQLARRGVIEDKVGGRHVVLFYSPEGLSPVDAAAMDESRSVGSTGVFASDTGTGRLRFRRVKERIEDRDTGSGWSVTGKSFDGVRKGTALKPVEHGLYFAFAWLAFQPDTVVVGESPAPATPQP